MTQILSIKGLTKTFGHKTVVDDVSFSAGTGEVLGFLGPNGAGKSTTMKMIVGFLTPTSGTAVVCGHDVSHDPLAVKAAVGYLPEGAPAYPDMTPLGFLGFIAGVRGFDGADRRARVDRVVEMTRIQEVVRQPIETLSKGFKRRVGLAQALLHDPRVLILDEPTDGLDPNQKQVVRELIRDMSQEKCIVISTHILEEVDAVCSRAMIIAAGKVVADASPAELKAQSGSGDLDEVFRKVTANA
ncbi:MAG: ABC transporter ATP-binding protein [Alphaproteobacteria bacterium]|jgi:ABC-2 type transport system ATP-binding protein|nr:ABC transporter ATP-binding protein [Alphaproteobacteria bacterium]